MGGNYPKKISKIRKMKKKFFENVHTENEG